MERVGCGHGVQGCHTSLLICFFLVNAGFMANALTKVQQYIQNKEMEVQLIATNAVKNAFHCDYVHTCQQPNGCSAAACFQTLAESYCVGVTNNGDCTCKTQARADYTRSYIRVPGLGDGLLSTNDEIVTAICTQRNLDVTTFVTNNSQYLYQRDNIFYSFYLGTVDGTFRFFPGTAIKDCDGYDPRLRPWYMGAISVVKDLEVLVDVASSMTNSKEFIGSSQTSALAMATNMTKQLLNTLTQGDRATVMAYYGDDLLLLNASYTVPPADGTPLDLSADSLFLDLLNKVSSLGSTGTTDPSNTTAAIQQALQLLSTAGSPSGALKVIVVLTDGQSTVPPEQDDLVRQINTSGITLFIYQIDGNDGGMAALTSNLMRGRNERVNINPTTVLNPLYTLKAYFSFLANARNSSGTDLVFWQPPYQDYGFLGQIRTVTYPAISSNGDLVGVAGIDIQDSKIDPTIATEIKGILNNKLTHPPTILPAQIPKLSASSYADESTLCNASSVGTTSRDAVCQLIDTQIKYPEGLCCSQSGCIEQPKNLTPLWICLGIVGALAMTGVVFMVWKKKKQPSESLQHPPEVICQAEVICNFLHFTILGIPVQISQR